MRGVMGRDAGGNSGKIASAREQTFFEQIFGMAIIIT